MNFLPQNYHSEINFVGTFIFHIVDNLRVEILETVNLHTQIIDAGTQ